MKRFGSRLLKKKGVKDYTLSGRKSAGSAFGAAVRKKATKKAATRKTATKKKATRKKASRSISLGGSGGLAGRIGGARRKAQKKRGARAAAARSQFRAKRVKRARGR